MHLPRSVTWFLWVQGEIVAVCTDGLIPHLAGPASVTVAAGIVGATVMPHVIYLHSALTQEHAANDASGAALQASRVDIVAAPG